MREFLRLVTAMTLLASFATSSTAAAQTPPGVSVIEDGLERVDPTTGEERWVVHHGSVWTSPEHTEKQASIVGPAEVSQGLYYAVGAWLFRIDVVNGVIAERLSFPAPIVELGTDGDVLTLTVETETENGGKTLIPMRYRPGTPSPREMWKLTAWMAPRRDVSHLAPSIDNHTDDITEAERRAAIALLETQQRQEPANPFYSFFIGDEYRLLGEGNQAQGYFEGAAANKDAHWSSDVQLATMFDEIGQYDRGDVVFDRAMKKLDAVQPSLHRTWSLVVYAVLMGVALQNSISNAVVAKDYAAVDRMESRIYRLFPYLEQSPRAWNLLADWFAEQNQPELAAKWRKNAHEAAQTPWARLNDASWDFDRALVLFMGFSIGLWALMLLIGLRAPPSKRHRWLPHPRIVDYVAIAIAIGLTVPCMWVMLTTSNRIARFTAAPLEAMMSDSWASPNSIEWLEAQTPSKARDQLLDHAHALEQAYATAAQPPAPLDNGAELVVSTIDADAAHRALTTVTSAISLRTASRMLLIPPWAIFAVLLLIVGGVIQIRFPRVARAICTIVPGGAASSGILAGVLVGLTIAALASILFGFDSILSSLAMPTYSRYFGLENIGEEKLTAPHTWAWIALASVVLIHLATTWLDRGDDKHDLLPADTEAH